MPKSRSPGQKAAKKRYKQKRRAEARAVQIATGAPKSVGAILKAMPLKVSGHGNYVTDAANKVAEVATYQPSSTFGKATKAGVEAAMGALGLPGGSLLGSAASWVTKLFGGGRYGAGFNSLQSNSMIPMFASRASGFRTNSNATFATGAQSIRLRNREFVMDVKSSQTFAKTVFAINPGNPLLFPWGSKIASLYEEGRIHGLIFEYRPMSADAVGSLSSGMGTVIQATEYDVYDDAFVTKQAMEDALFSVSCAPYNQQYHPIECKSKWNPTNQLMVQPGLITSTGAVGDARFSCLGNYTIATQGQQTTGDAIGELWVHYDIELSRPTLEATDSSFTQHLMIGMNNTTGLQVLHNSNPNTGMTISTGSGIANFTLGPLMSPGTFLISVVWWCPGAGTNPVSLPVGPQFYLYGSATRPNLAVDPLTGIVNAVGMNCWASNNHYAFATSNTAVGTSVITLPDNAGSFSLNFPDDQPYVSAPNGNQYCDIYVTAFNMNYNARRERQLTRSTASSGAAIQALRDDVTRLFQRTQSLAVRSSPAASSTSTDDGSERWNKVVPDDYAEFQAWKTANCNKCPDGLSLRTGNLFPSRGAELGGGRPNA